VVVFVRRENGDGIPVVAWRLPTRRDGVKNDGGVSVAA
jgi:hypothetical protein